MNIIEQAKAIAERNRKARVELSDLREMHEKLVGLLPPPGKILTVREFVELLKNIREILK